MALQQFLQDDGYDWTGKS